MSTELATMVVKPNAAPMLCGWPGCRRAVAATHILYRVMDGWRAVRVCRCDEHLLAGT